MGYAPASCLAADGSMVRADQDARPTVLLLHGSAGSGAIWRQPAAALQPLYDCLAPDLLGYGAAKAWPKDTPFTLDDERMALEPLLAGSRTFHLVGYSYGGVVALQLALANPERVRTLTLIEPVFFNVLREAQVGHSFDHFVALRRDFVGALARGAPESALQPFIDFWAGDRAWQKLPDPVRAELLKCAGKIALDWEATFAFSPTPRSLIPLGPRTLLIRGDQSPRPMLELVDALHALLLGSSRIVVPGANHLLPITYAAELTDVILLRLTADTERPAR